MLVKYEFIKILRKKSTLIVMLVSLIVTAFLFGLPIMQYQTYNQDGVIKGLDGIAYDKEQCSKISVALSEEYIMKTILEVQELFKNPDNVGNDGHENFLIGDAYWNSIAPREKLLNMIAKTYDAPNESSGYNRFADLNITSGANFYETMKSKIDTLLNSSSRALSDNQKEYWGNMAHQVDTPLQYGYFEGWEVIITSLELLMFSILAICIVIAPVFAGEYQAGTDAVILAAKYGKTKLIRSKLLAAFLFGICAFSLHILVACGIPLLAFGIDGWNLPVQIANTTIPYPMTFLQITLLSIGVIYLVLCAMISFTLLLSSRMKTPYLVLVVIVPILFLPMFLSPNGTTGIYNLTLFLLPYRATIPEIGKYISYQFDSIVLDVFSVRIILYTLFTIVMLPLARLGFKKHQVA